MSPAFQHLLRGAAPSIFMEGKGDAECGCGWFPLLLDLCKKLEAVNQTLPEEDRCKVVQIKEKFGGLRVYLYAETDEMNGAVEEAENKALETCELCAYPGSLRNDSYTRTLCNWCYHKKP